MKGEGCLTEAIILCGGTGWRLKPHTWVPKPLLPLKEESTKYTLLDLQIEWLKKHGFEGIVLATNQKFETKHQVTQVVENKKLGTGGAVKNAAQFIDGNEVYVMNVDDIVSYNPKELFRYSDAGAAILLAKPRIGFGVVKTENSFVVGFEEKPIVDFYVSAGHYVFKKKIIEDYFPEVGDLERETLPILAKKRLLRGMKLEGEWYTINTYKDYLTIKQLIENGKIKLFTS